MGSRHDAARATMRLALPIVWSDRHRLHEPGGEVSVGVRTPGTVDRLDELPERDRQPVVLVRPRVDRGARRDGP